MLKNILLIVLFTLTTSCGYEAVYSKKNRIINTDFSITKISLSGDREINIQIKKKLDTFTKIEKNKNYALDIETEAKRTTIANDTKGDPSVFKIEVNVFAIATMQDDTRTEIQFTQNFKYNNIQDKFELKRYEREIKNNLAETITTKLLSKLLGY